MLVSLGLCSGLCRALVYCRWGWILQISKSVSSVFIDRGENIDFGGRIINTVMAWQHPEGGFGGGPGQAAHLLTTYASVCTLAVAGQPGPGGGWDQIDR